jgi:hypothetical protein
VAVQKAQIQQVVQAALAVEGQIQVILAVPQQVGKDLLEVLGRPPEAAEAAGQVLLV